MFSAKRDRSSKIKYKRFRRKVFEWSVILFIVIFAFIMLGVLVHAGDMLKSQERRWSHRIVKDVLRNLPKDDAEFDLEARKRIEVVIEHWTFGNQGTDIAIFSNSGHELFNTDGFDMDDPFNDPRYQTIKHSKLFFISVHSGAHFDDWLATWKFLFRYEQSDYVIFVSRIQRYELFERLTEGFIGAIAIALLSAFFISSFVSRKIVSPLEHVSAAAKIFGKGNLKERITDVHTNDEFMVLSDTLNKAFEDVEFAVNQLENFANAAAHEFRTPLTSICGHLEIALIGEPTREECLNVIQTAHEDGLKLARLVEKLLILARPAELSVNGVSRIDLSEVIHTLMDIYEHAESSRFRELRIEIEPDIFISGDKSLLTSLVSNIMDNAFKYSPHDSPIKISLKTDAEFVRMMVEDRGDGFTSEQKSHLFEPFYRAHDQTLDGVGLGLTIVKWIIEAHKGSIEVDCDESGTRFVVLLPLSK